MCEEARWQDEDDGTALICDGTATLLVRPLGPGTLVEQYLARELDRGERRFLDAYAAHIFCWGQGGSDAQNQAEDEGGEAEENRKSDA